MRYDVFSSVENRQEVYVPDLPYLIHILPPEG